MNRAVREAERMNNLHLYMLVIMTVTVMVEVPFAIIMGWEVWMTGIIAAGFVFCWIIHVRGMFSMEQRRIMNALVIWLMVFYHGVHPTSLFDMTLVVIVELLLFSQMNSRKYLHVSIGLYIFCFLYQMYLVMFTDQTGIVLDLLTLTRIELHLFIVAFVYWAALVVLKRRERDEDSYEQRISELQKTQDRTEEFLADMSHELRAPIHTVMETGSLMMQRAKSADGKEHAEQVFRAGHRLSAQINAMLDFAEIEAGQVKLVKEPYMLSSVLNDVIEELDLYKREGLPDVLVDVDADLPRKLSGDERLLKKILYQMIENAVKFTKEGAVYVALYGDVRTYGINLCIDVQDTGIGMSRKTLERIRSSTYQADADRTRRTGGLGMGITIIAGLVRAMNGFFTISSSPGAGTLVHAAIPQEIADEERCMDVPHPDRLRIAFYQNPAKFKIPVVRDYYARMILHVIQNFGLTLQRTGTREDLKKLLDAQVFTHLFTADEEYTEDPVFYEGLCDSMRVIVVAKNSFRPRKDAKIIVLRKPLFTVPLVKLLNEGTA